MLNIRNFTPLEAECPTACPVRNFTLRALAISNGACNVDECGLALANAGFNAPRELLTGFTIIAHQAPKQVWCSAGALTTPYKITGPSASRRFASPYFVRGEKCFNLLRFIIC